MQVVVGDIISASLKQRKGACCSVLQQTNPELDLQPLAASLHSCVTNFATISQKHILIATVAS